MINRKLAQFFVIFICSVSICIAHPAKKTHCESQCTHCVTCIDPVEEKVVKESFLPLPYVAIAFYKPTYALPYYYTGSPYNSVYTYHTPGWERIKSSEVKYQISLKTPVWKNILYSDTSFYFAYTLRTYFQVYSKWQCIRETDYEPEVFLTTPINCPLINTWHLNYLNYGYVHQSNGTGNSLQRSWDRLYVEAVTSTENWRFSLRPWAIIVRHGNNPNIGSYLGYAQFVAAFTTCGHVLALEIPNIGAVPKHTSAMLTWSFPITPYLKGYAQVFSGYGQSLLEYDHRTNSFGIGFALSDWI